jgi:hypothetical protein
MPSSCLRSSLLGLATLALGFAAPEVDVPALSLNEVTKAIDSNEDLVGLKALLPMMLKNARIDLAGASPLISPKTQLPQGVGAVAPPVAPPAPKVDQPVLAKAVSVPEPPKRVNQAPRSKAGAAPGILDDDVPKMEKTLEELEGSAGGLTGLLKMASQKQEAEPEGYH